MEKLQWQLELLDKMSGPANKAGAALLKLQITLDRGGDALNNHGARARSAAGGLESFVTKMHSGIEIAKTLGETIISVTRSIVSMSSSLANAVIHEAEFHQSTMTTLTTLLGAQEGRREFKGDLRLASRLPGTTQQFVSQRRNLVGMGFTNRSELDRMFALQQDIQALNPDDSSVGDRAGLILSQLRASGRTDLMHLREATRLNAGIGLGDVYQHIAQNRGLRGANVTQQVRELISSGKVTGDEGIAAIAQTVMGHTHGALGSFADQQGSSLAGRMSNIMDLPSTVMQRFFMRSGGATGSPGMKAFSDTLERINALFADGAPGSERLMRIFDKLINGVFGQLRSVDPVAIINAIFDVMDSMVPVVIGLVQGFKLLFGEGFKVLSGMLKPLLDGLGNAAQNTAFLSMLAETGRVLGFVGGLVVWFFAMIGIGTVAVLGGLGMALEGIAGALSDAGHFLVDIGKDLLGGLAEGIATGAGAVWDAVKNVGQGVLDRFRGIFQIHSPSRVMFRMGGFLGDGLAMGIADSADAVHAELGNLVPAFNPTVTASGISARSAGTNVAQGGINVTLQFQLPDGASSPDAIAEAVRPVAIAAISEALERAAMHAGVA